MDLLIIVLRAFFVISMTTASLSLSASIFDIKKAYSSFFLSLFAGLIAWSAYLITVQYG